MQFEKIRQTENYIHLGIKIPRFNIVSKILHLNDAWKLTCEEYKMVNGQYPWNYKNCEKESAVIQQNMKSISSYREKKMLKNAIRWGFVGGVLCTVGVGYCAYRDFSENPFEIDHIINPPICGIFIGCAIGLGYMTVGELPAIIMNIQTLWATV